MVSLSVSSWFLVGLGRWIVRVTRLPLSLQFTLKASIVISFNQTCSNCFETIYVKSIYPVPVYVKAMIFHFYCWIVRYNAAPLNYQIQVLQACYSLSATNDYFTVLKMYILFWSSFHNIISNCYIYIMLKRRRKI